MLWLWTEALPLTFWRAWDCNNTNNTVFFVFKQRGEPLWLQSPQIQSPPTWNSVARHWPEKTTPWNLVHSVCRWTVKSVSLENEHAHLSLTRSTMRSKLTTWDTQQRNNRSGWEDASTMQPEMIRQMMRAFEPRKTGNEAKNYRKIYDFPSCSHSQNDGEKH